MTAIAFAPRVFDVCLDEPSPGYTTMKRLWMAALVGMAGCRATLPCADAVRQHSGKAEALSGLKAAADLESRFGGVYTDAEAERRMERLGCGLCRAADLPAPSARYRLLDSDDLNALSLPGPRVYITRGLYVRLASDDVLAAVIAHELAHVRARDHYRARGADAEECLARELAADAGAVELLTQAGVPAEAMRAVLIIVKPALPADWASRRACALAQIDDP